VLVDLAPKGARVVWLSLVAALLMLGVPAIARAAMIHPNVVTDEGTGTGNCSRSESTAAGGNPSTQQCSLRQAIELAQPGDAISLTPPSPTTTYTLTQGVLSIENKDITIVGSGEAITAAKKEFGLFSIASSGAATIEDLALTNGHAALGSAVANSGTLTVRDDMIFANEAAAGSFGGALENGIGASLTVLDSTISKNSAEEGGGIDSDGTLAIVNSTITENSAMFGGGVYVSHNTGTTQTIANATIAGNTATQGGNINFGGGPVQVKSSIIDAGTATEGADCFLRPLKKSVESGGYNLTDATLEECELGAVGDKEGVSDIDLGALQANGGPTETMALEPGSAAIAAGNPTGCSDQDAHLLQADQRGVARPQLCDVGAYQTPVPDLAVSVAVAPTVIQGQPFTYTVTITNSGAATAEGVTMTDETPSGATLLSGPGCSGTATLTCSIGTLAAGEKVSISVTVEQAQLGVATDAAQVTGTARDSELLNNLARASTAVEPATTPSPSSTSATPPGSASPPASTPPSAGNLIMAFKQKLESTLSAYFLCKVASCVVTVSGNIKAGKKTIPVALKPVTIKANQKQKLAIKLSKKLRLELAKALAKHQKVTLTIAASVRFGAFSAKTRPLTSTLER
jgi:uncharacterized repeat protein (TIGR01451 family)